MLWLNEAECPEYSVDENTDSKLDFVRKNKLMDILFKVLEFQLVNFHWGIQKVRIVDMEGKCHQSLTLL